MLIVGGGFAGLGCAFDLVRSDAVRITLLDRHNYHQFQPLFYQLATSQLSVRDVSFSLRRVFREKSNIDIKLVEVTRVDPKTRTVETKEGETYQGDFLVLAAGSQANFFNIPLTGAVAYAMWLGVHLALLTTLQVKIETFVEWVWDYFLQERGVQLLNRSDAARIDWYGDQSGDKNDTAAAK